MLTVNHLCKNRHPTKMLNKPSSESDMEQKMQKKKVQKLQVSTIFKELVTVHVEYYR